MTALLYLLEPERVCIATDSLVLDFEKKPLKYATKSFVFPHLRGIICGTGALDLLLQWVFFVESRAVINRIDVLDNVAPAKLRSIVSEMRFPDGLSSTIYHFGIDSVENKFIGFAYRSNNNFESEKLIYSLGVKPPYGDLEKTALDLVYEQGLPKSFNIIMERQRQYEERLAPEERVGIGGEVHFTMLTNDGIFTQITHTFENYEILFEEILRRNDISRID